MSDVTTALAWRVEVDSYSCIVTAATEPKARWVAVAAYWEAGHGDGQSRRRSWPSGVRARREPRFDDHPTLVRLPRAAHGESYL